MGDSKSALPNDVARAFHDLRDKFKHGHHIIKILESQLETARQNISLLQGQIRLANETIENLKQQFQEADITLAYMTDNYKINHERRHEAGRQSGRDGDDYSQAPVFVARNDEQENQRRLVEFEKNSKTCLSKSNDIGVADNEQIERTKTPTQQGQERPKSPYAQQLRQVLDALQDEDPRKSLYSHESSGVSSHGQPQMCMCSECVSSNTTHRHYHTDTISRRSPGGCEYSSSEMHYHDECAKHKSIAHTNEEGTAVNRSASTHLVHHENSTSTHISNATHSSHHVDYSSQCTGPCCTSIDLSKGYKIVEKSPGMPQYIAPRSPRRQKQHESRHDPHCHQLVSHCEEEKCRCHAYVSYAPFGYQVVESSPGVPRSIQPISPSLISKKTKRFMPLAPGDEPPHLKYTKVKRIDGSKVAAQKTIQDFSKRRLQPYNPRWDLDLLIVPPPMPASELFTTLGHEQGSSTHHSSDHSGDAAFSGESMSIDGKGKESPMIKSKVINSGGTVVVLTENDQQQRSVVSHSVLSMAQIEPSGSFMNEAPYETETMKLGSEHRDFKIEKRSDDDEMLDADNKPMKHRDYDLQTSRASLLGNPKPSGDFGLVNTRTPTSPHPTYKMPTSPPGNMQNFNAQESELKAKASMQISMTTERNNNSLGNRQAINNVHENDNDGEQLESVVLDAPSNLSGRYDNILFQKSQDFGRLSNDEEYLIHNRVKGKVH